MAIKQIIVKLIPKSFFVLYELYRDKRYNSLSLINKFSTPSLCKRYKINAIECFLFDFYHRSEEERDNYLSDRIVSTKSWEVSDNKFFVENVSDKFAFYQYNKEFFRRKAIRVSSSDDKDRFIELCQLSDVFVKPLDASMGEGIFRVYKEKDEPNEVFDKRIYGKGTWIVEQFIDQSPVTAAFNDSAVNTFRIPTILCDDGSFHVLGPFMRTSRKGMIIDNAAKGGIITAIDPSTGLCISDGFTEFGEPFERHPDSKIKFKGFQIPEWNVMLDIVEKAHRKMPQIKYLAYDMAYSKEGWMMVEANCGQFVGQFATKQGLKKEFLEYMNR